MKKILTLILTLLILVSMVACGGNNSPENNDNTAAPADTAADTQQTDSASDAAVESDTAGDPQGGDTAEGAKLTGKVDLIELDDRDASILRGIRIMGNRIGTRDDINGKESSLTDVRCIFELNEWVEFYPDTDAEYYLRVWVLKHRDDQEYYYTCKFSDLMPNFVNYCDLHYPVDEENPDEYQWGAFYLNPEECEPGYYDFVFTFEGKAIATLPTRFYKEGELTGKSAAELEALMHE
ncbi:MAG: hypothetical protein IJT70_07835 [Clostridia bacterium]|nr:hypothetical protein [Clostridia bacterium]